MKLEQIIYEEKFYSETSIEGIEIDNITTHADDITERTLFVMIKSIKFDVNKIISYILSKRPAAIICEYSMPISSDEIPVLKVADTRRILPYLYSRFYEIDYGKMRFAAVTGTNGKTTTATMLAHILTYSGKKVGFIGTGKIIANGKRLSDSKYSMTTPDPEKLYSVIKQMQNKGCDTVVMEVSSHALYFNKVLPIRFEASVFTNLSHEHLDFHGDMESYYQTKKKLFLQTKTGIFNIDDPYSKRCAEECLCNKTKVGIIYEGDVIARDVIMNGLLGSEYIYRDKKRLFKVRLNIGGAYNIYNSIMAITAAITMGVLPCVAKEALSKLKFIDGRLEKIEDDITVIIDYAHTEEALLNVLKTLNSTKKQGQKLITVFGCGGERDREKRPRMAKIAEELSDFIIVTTDNSRGEPVAEIISDILDGFTETRKRKVITSRKSAIKNAILTAHPGDFVAIIGKGHERYNIDKNGYHDFDERAIIKEALNERRDALKNENNTRNKSDVK